MPLRHPCVRCCAAIFTPGKAGDSQTPFLALRILFLDPAVVSWASKCFGSLELLGWKWRAPVAKLAYQRVKDLPNRMCPAVPKLCSIAAWHHYYLPSSSHSRQPSRTSSADGHQEQNGVRFLPRSGPLFFTAKGAGRKRNGQRYDRCCAAVCNLNIRYQHAIPHRTFTFAVSAGSEGDCIERHTSGMHTWCIPWFSGNGLSSKKRIRGCVHAFVNGRTSTHEICCR